MTKISLLDKLQVLFNITKSNIFYPIIIIALILISFLFITTNKNNTKESKKTYGTIYAIILTISLIKYGKSLATMFDYMVNNLFIVFYFPNIAVYLVAIIATNVIMWVSMFSTKTKQLIKIINSIVFSLIHYIFILILNLINTKNINVFNQKELYENIKIHSLIELSSNIFIAWILFLIIYKIIITYLDSKKVEEVYNNSTLTVEHINATNENLPFSIKLPDNVIQINHPYILKREVSKPQIVYNFPKQQENTAIYEQMLTLDDYKLLVSMLNEQRQKENARKNNQMFMSNINKESFVNNTKTFINELSNDNENPYRNIQNSEMTNDNANMFINHQNNIKEQPKEENPLSELMALYKSVS